MIAVHDGISNIQSDLGAANEGVASSNEKLDALLLSNNAIQVRIYHLERLKHGTNVSTPGDNVIF